MKYPSSLLTNNRKTFNKTCIKDFNYLYTRHKPSTDWKEEDGLPDFSKIKLDQSFNWCNFSIPIWTRFNNKKEYLHDYAIAGFYVKTIRESHKNSSVKFTQKILEIEHRPEEYNYSHCQLVTLKNLSKTEKRALRMTLRHKCITPLKPNEKRNFYYILLDIMKMFCSRIISRNTSTYNQNFLIRIIRKITKFNIQNCQKLKE